MLFGFRNNIDDESLSERLRDLNPRQMANRRSQQALNSRLDTRGGSEYSEE